MLQCNCNSYVQQRKPKNKTVKVQNSHRHKIHNGDFLMISISKLNKDTDMQNNSQPCHTHIQHSTKWSQGLFYTNLCPKSSSVAKRESNEGRLSDDVTPGGSRFWGGNKKMKELFVFCWTGAIMSRVQSCSCVCSLLLALLYEMKMSKGQLILILFGRKKIKNQQAAVEAIILCRSSKNYQQISDIWMPHWSVTIWMLF